MYTVALYVYIDGKWFNVMMCVLYLLGLNDD